MLIENTAGGNGAMARSLDAIARLWDAVSDAAAGGGEVGFCLDTCHANSAGIDLADAVDRVKAITGRIDLVHCNNSRDEFGSGADRHANFDVGHHRPARCCSAWSARRARPPSARRPRAGGLAADVSWLRDQQLTRGRLAAVAIRGVAVAAASRMTRRSGAASRTPPAGSSMAAGAHHVPFG